MAHMRAWLCLCTMLGFSIGGCGGDDAPAVDAGPRTDGGGTDAPLSDSGGQDGGTDGGRTCVPVADHAVSDAPGSSGRPSLAWNGSGWAVAFADDRTGAGQIYVALLDAEGNKLGADHELTSRAAAWFPEIAYSGDGYGVAYTIEMPTPATVHFVRVTSAGEPDGTVLDVGQGGGLTSLVWTGEEYGLAHHSGQNAGFGTDIYLARIDASGALIGSETRVTDDPGNEFVVTLDWNGTSYAMVFHHGQASSSGTASAPSGGYFAAVDSSGTEIGMERLVTGTDTGSGGGLRMASSPTGNLVTWGNGVNGSLAWLDVSGAGAPSASVMVPRGPSDVLWAGSEYAVAWSMSGAMVGGEVFLATVPASEGEGSAPIPVSSGGVADVNAVQIASNGIGGYGVAWADTRAMPAEIHFAVVCP